MTNRYGWHLRSANGLLDYNDGRLPKVGERLMYRVAGRKPRKSSMPMTCAPGMHAAPQIRLCMRKKGTLLSFVLVEDANSGRDKFVGRTRTILWQAELPPGLWELGMPAPSEKELLAWAHSAGFRRPSCRRRAAAAKKRPVVL